MNKRKIKNKTKKHTQYKLNNFQFLLRSGSHFEKSKQKMFERVLSKYGLIKSRQRRKAKNEMKKETQRIEQKHQAGINDAMNRIL